jgi:hypothetical protein
MTQVPVFASDGNARSKRPQVRLQREIRTVGFHAI